MNEKTTTHLLVNIFLSLLLSFFLFFLKNSFYFNNFTMTILEMIDHVAGFGYALQLMFMGDKFL